MKVLDVVEFEKLVDILLSDVREAEKAHRLLSTDFTRRTLVKTLFTYLEGHLFAFKQLLLSLEYQLAPALPYPRMETKIVLYSEEERAMLEEFSYDLASGGRARRHTYNPRFGDNVKFAFSMFHKATRLADDLNFNCEGWTRLLEAQEIRNRLTHPKLVEFLAITEQEVKIVEIGIKWYESTMERMMAKFENESIYARHFKAGPGTEAHG